MINSYRKQLGAAILVITVIMMVAALLLIMYAARYSGLQVKTSANQAVNAQSFEAAEAGLEYGLAYLNQNSDAIAATASGGFIVSPSNSSLTSVSLANGASYSIIYSNPVANDYNRILITATGTSSDGTSPNTLRQLTQKRGLLSTIPLAPSTIVGNVVLQGNTKITSAQSAYSVVSGSTVTIGGSATTDANNGNSDKNKNGGDLSINNTAISSKTPDDFFQDYFGVPTNIIQTWIANFFPAGSSPSLAGLSGTTIWVDQSLSTSDDIGTATAPVLLIVNGNLNLTGNGSIYGFVYVMGDISLGGNTIITGAVSATGSLNTASGSSEIHYDTSMLSLVKNQTTPNPYAKVPGGWRDF